MTRQLAKSRDFRQNYLFEFHLWQSRETFVKIISVTFISGGSSCRLLISVTSISGGNSGWLLISVTSISGGSGGRLLWGEGHAGWPGAGRCPPPLLAPVPRPPPTQHPPPVLHKSQDQGEQNVFKLPLFKLPSWAGSEAEIINCGSGSFLFIKDSKKFYRKKIK